MKILLVGVPGVGKTSLGRYLSEKNIAIHEPSGERKKEMLRQLGIRKHLADCNNTESLLINAWYYQRIERLTVATPGPYLIDTHASYPLVDGSFVNLLPCTFKADALIQLRADATIVAQRRIDRGRAKDAVDVKLIELELDMENEFTARYIRLTQIPFLTVDNTKDWQYTWIHQFIKDCRKFYARKQ
jgi:adenylate kinase